MRSSLIIRMAVYLFLFLLGTIGAMVYAGLRSEKQHLLNTVISKAIQNSDIIEASTRYSMLQNRKDDLYRIIKDIGNPSHGVVGIRYYDKDGTVLFSTDEDEIGGWVDRDAEACVICHEGDGPPVIAEAKEMIRIFRDDDDTRIIGLINPIHNEPDCYNAACHAHSPDEKILGVLDVRMSLAEVDATIGTITINTWSATAVIIVVLAAGGGFFVYRFVYIRMQQLVEGTKEISMGNLDYRFAITVGDEVSDVAQSFNEMAEALKKARKENEEWADELQKRVAEKSAELEEAYNHLVDVEKMVSLGKLSATVAHELNNPLSGILTYVKLISNEIQKDENIDDEKAERLLEDIGMVIRETKRCGNIVKNLLVFARNKPGALERFNLAEVIELGLKMVNHHLEIKQLESEFTQTEGDDHIEGDADLIEQALLAMFINSVEAMEGGGKLSVHLDKSGEDTVKILVHDTGQGIAEDKLKNIFKPFYSTKGNKHSTGLGLAVVYGIVHRHCGDVAVDSELGVSTTFTITLPRKLDLETFNQDQLVAPEKVPDKDQI